jgi:hypothetical protein
MLNISDVDLVTHDLVDGNSHFIEEYLKIYQDLFPQYTRYLPVMRQRAKMRASFTSNEKWHQWFLMIGNDPVGIVGFLYNRKRNVGLLMDFAIYSNARKFRVDGDLPFARFVLNLSMQQLIEDARESGHTAPICLAAEVEYPALVKKYIEYGYVKFPIEYFEPPNTPELEKVGDKIQELKTADYGQMYIGAFPIPGHPIELNTPVVIRTVLSALLEDHYQLPSDHWLVQKVVHEIPV